MTHSSHIDRHAKLRTLSIGGATFDLFLDVNPELSNNGSFVFPLGAKINVKNVIGTCGGGANNTAVGLSRLGCHAHFSGVLGDDQWGRELHANMERENVDTRYLSIIDHEPSSFSLILRSPAGERTILTHKSMDRHFHDVTFDREAASTMQAVYLNHLHEDTCVIENDIIDALRATPNIHLTWNPGGRQIDEGWEATGNRNLLATTDLLLVNKEEALAFAHADTVEHALKILTDAGATIVCITDGAAGATASDGTEAHFCPALPCAVVDATGAGDAFGTAMTWALISGKTLPIALKAGTINATSVVGSVGAQSGLLTDTQIESKLSL